ncbi:hypothetical protein [Winogradskyella sp. HaHa_3_26]|nr:hypothetical protein [Winogradskyella sp. HaHa_3_26]QXP78840.1 hypothetical protein H0I32_16790 [Winogradskyella sp. HaHa_3_26]QXP78858.1 hypothetical protein H0I32_16890 [Winogradskyella sp. HaHa_3_26]
MDRTTLKEIIYNINYLCTSIELSKKGIEKLKDKSNEQAYLDIQKLQTLYICSLLDELKVFEKFSKEQNNEYIPDTQYVLIPLVNYLKKFDSFRVKRNKLLAHLNRNRNKDFNPWWKELNGKRFITTELEEKMVFSAIKTIHKIFKNRFSKELEESMTVFEKEIDVYAEKIYSIKNVNSYEDIKPVILETQKRMKEKDFEMKVVLR